MLVAIMNILTMLVLTAWVAAAIALTILVLARVTHMVFVEFKKFE